MMHLVIDPADESLPDDWLLCARSIETGVRLGLPVWLRYARRLRERLGEGYTVVAGRLAIPLLTTTLLRVTPGTLCGERCSHHGSCAFCPGFGRSLPGATEYSGRRLQRDGKRSRGTALGRVCSKAY